MYGLPRQRPDPIPAIHPVPEYLVSGQQALWYEQMKQALQVPWMGVVTMAFAHYPKFFATLWQGLNPLCQSAEFVDASQSLREHVEQEVATLNPPSLAAKLGQLGYAPGELELLRQVNSVFSHGNPLYLLIATLARYLLEAGELEGTADSHPFEGRHAPYVQVPLVLMEYHHADPGTQAVYADIREKLNLPFVNTDYRAFARWPSYFSLAWSDLRQVVNGQEHEKLCQAIHDQAVALVSGFSNPGGLSAVALRQAAAEDASLKEIRAMCQLFQWLLPGLMVNVAYLRLQLQE